MEEDLELYDEFGNYIGPGEQWVVCTTWSVLLLIGLSVTVDLESEDEDGPVEEEDDDMEDEEEEEANEPGMSGEVSGYLEGDGEGTEGRIVLHEDKKYYPTAMEVYGEEVETTVQEEDTQPITQPIVAPIKPKNYDLVEKRQPATIYSQVRLPPCGLLRHCLGAKADGHVWAS